MPRLSGVFEQFPSIEKIPLQNLTSWLKANIDKHALMDMLGNRILYPQTVALNESELEIDLAILREALRLSPTLVYEAQTNKLFIPGNFVPRFPPIQKLAGAIIEALNPKGVNQIFLKNQNNKPDSQGPGFPKSSFSSFNPQIESWKFLNDKNKPKLIGTLISPTDIDKLAEKGTKISVSVNGVINQLAVNTISLSRINTSPIRVKIGEKEYEAWGGELGIIIDLRI